MKEYKNLKYPTIFPTAICGRIPKAVEAAELHFSNYLTFLLDDPEIILRRCANMCRYI